MAEKMTVVALHVEEGDYPITIQGYIHYNPSVQTEMRSLKTVTTKYASLTSIAGKILGTFILIRLDFYQKVSVDSGKTEEQ